MPDTPSQLDDALVERYIAEECTLSEAERAEAWIASYPREGSALLVLRHRAAQPARLPFRIDVLGARQRLWERLGLRYPEGDFLPQPTTDTRRRPNGANEGRGAASRIFARPFRQGPLWYSAAALVVAGLVLLVGWYVGARGVTGRMAKSMLTYTTANGERARIALPDGSIVSLNVASRLEVPADYAAGDHTVRLVGEALFTVAHHNGSPFTVIAGPSTTRVLGTSFVVRHYATDPSALVVVRKGRVAVQSTVVAAQQEAELSAGSAVHLQPANPSAFTFATGVLTIDDTVLPNAIPELNRWYDADIRLGTPTLATQHIAGKFAAGSLADLTTILQIMGIRVVRDGRVLTLYAR